MDDRDLLSFIADVQLQCGKDHIISDLVLHALEQLRKGEISCSLCSDIIKTVLRPYPEMLERFSVIVEDAPPPNTRTGCIVDEPFINTSIEFELWPGSLGRFLKMSRRALLKQITIDDVFVDLEHIRDNTSGPFWLLWELYEPILQNSSFMQAVYDGCVGQETIPLHYLMPLKPSESDNDPTAAVADTIIDSDLVCCYASDCRAPNRPLGLLKHGSYGLLDRKIVNVHCAGRTQRDFAVLNDRWATAASGSEGQFQPAQKNQYEERLFLMEDERVTLDVRICRLKLTLSRLEKLSEMIKTGDNGILFNETNALDSSLFPRNYFNSLDMLSLKELYSAEHLPTLLRKIAERPIEMIAIVAARIEDRIVTLVEVRKNKESDYHDVNKKNYSRSLEVRHDDNKSNSSSASSSSTSASSSSQQQQHAQQQHVMQQQPIFSLDASFVVDFDSNSVKAAAEMIAKTCKLLSSNNSSGFSGKDTNIPALLEFILSLFGLAEPTPLHRHLRFSGYPSNTKIDQTKTTSENHDMVGENYNNQIKNLNNDIKNNFKDENKFGTKIGIDDETNYNGETYNNSDDDSSQLSKKIERKYLLSTEITNLFGIFAKITAIVEKLLSAQPIAPQSAGSDMTGARGIQLAVAIGNVSASIFQPSFAQDAISDAIPNYIINGRHNPALESLFEMPSNLQPGSLETLKKSVQSFIRTAQNAFLDDSTQLFIDAVKCEDDKTYNAIVLEKLSGTTFYTATVNLPSPKKTDRNNNSFHFNDKRSEDETNTNESERNEENDNNGRNRNVTNGRPEITFKIQIPRIARTKHNLKVFFTAETGPALLDESVLEERQNKILTGRYSATAKATRRNTSSRPGLSDMMFRLSSNEIEFAPTCCHTAVMFRK